MKREFGLIFLLHLIIILLCLSSPFWLNWKIVLLGGLLLELQYAILGGCILSRFELGKDVPFWYYYLSKMFPGVRFNLRQGEMVGHFMSIIVVLIAWLVQEFGGIVPLI